MFKFIKTWSVELYICVAAIGCVVFLYQLHAYGTKKFNEGYASATTQYEAAYEKQVASQHKQEDIANEKNREFTAHLTELDETLHKREQELLVAKQHAYAIKCLLHKQPPASSSASPSTGSTSVPAEASLTGGSTDSLGDDLRPRLVIYGADSEALRQQVIGWQSWYKEFVNK